MLEPLACWGLFKSWDCALGLDGCASYGVSDKLVEFGDDLTVWTAIIVDGKRLKLVSWWQLLSGREVIRLVQILTALVSGTTEAINDSLETMRYRWRAGLLKTDDVASEAEAEITWVWSRNLLGRVVRFAFVLAAWIYNCLNRELATINRWK